MGWGILGKVVGAIFAGGKTTEKVADLADKAFHTDQEKAADTAHAVEVDQKDLASARAMQLVSHDSWFDIVIDGVNRMIRPGVTVWLVGGFVGWWTLPKTDVLSEFWQNVFMLVLTFWFGGRALLKDLPNAIRIMRGQ